MNGWGLLMRLVYVSTRYPGSGRFLFVKAEPFVTLSGAGLFESG